MRHAALFALSLAACFHAEAKTPNCSAPERWAAIMSMGQLEDAKLTAPREIDTSKTKVVLLASEKIGKDLYRQVHHITFTEKTGRKIEVITRNEASSEECSMSDVEVFVISGKLRG